MGIAEIATLIKLLPEFLKIAKTANKKMQDGAVIREIKQSLKMIDQAFEENNEKKAVDAINAVWRRPNIQ